MKKLFLLFSTVLLLVGMATTPARAEVMTSSKPQVVSKDPLLEIAKAEKEDPVLLKRKVEKLRTSTALMTLFAGAPDRDATEGTYLKFFAAISSEETVEKFVENTRGKRFVIEETEGVASVKLVSGEAVSTQGSCCACWKAWVAAGAYWLGTGMICTAVTAGGAVASGPGAIVVGFACPGVFWAIGNLPNFDNACR